MNITRNNYEEYFILYLDNELSSEDRKRVELFVQENSDLKEELDLLLQSQLVPDNSIVFNNKEQLMRSPGISNINTANYEEWLLLYTDNELPAEERIAVEQFVSSRPAIKAELHLLQKTKLQPEETLVFSNKESLYRTEEKVRVITIRWWRMAAAAALLLAVSATAFIVFNNKKEDATEIASGKIKEKKSIQGTPSTKQPPNEVVITNPQVANNTIPETEKEKTETSNPVAIKEKRIESKEKSVPSLNDGIKRNDAVVANKKEKKKTNDLPQPVYNPNVNRTIEQNNPIAKVDLSVKGSLTIPNETNNASTVTPNSSQPLDNVIAVASKESDDPVDAGQPGRKNKLRGFFRKVTRTFEKTTNIKATDDEDRLLLGGLAIKL